MQENNKQDRAIAVLENNYQHMTEKLNDLEKAVKEGFADLKGEFKCFREEADQKYASKLTEKIVYGMVALIVVGALTAMLTIIYK